jgi:hypothetical protein
MLDVQVGQVSARRQGGFSTVAVCRVRDGGEAVSKYHAEKTTVDGITFDSRAEAKRWQTLCMLEKAGQISNIKRQVAYQLAPGVKLLGETRNRPAIRYVADFAYLDKWGREVVEDVKGMDTPMSRLKRHLMATTLGVFVGIVK